MAARVRLHDVAALRSQLARATPGQRAVFAALSCDFEICNGGFHQLFNNPTGILYRDAVAGFERIGAHRYATLLEQAGALLGANVPRDHDTRIARLQKTPLDAWNDKVRGIEQRYYKQRAGKLSLERIARRYIEAHPDEFFI
jgi:hypothetical protein